MKKYKVWKTFPVNAGTWHTEEFIIEANFSERHSGGIDLNIYFTDEIPQPKADWYTRRKIHRTIASFSNEYSVIEIKSE